MATTIALGLLCGSGIYMALGLLIGRNRYPPGAAYMAAAMLGIAVWYVGAAGEVLTGSDPTSLVLWRSLKYVGVVTVIPAFFLFVVQFATRQRGGAIVTAITFAIPVITLLLVWTNPVHELMWPHPPPPPGTLPRQPWGPWFSYVYAPYSYLLLMGACLLLVRQIMSGSAVQRVQAAVLLAASLVPFTVNVAYTLNTELPDMQQTPIALGITALIGAWGFFRFRIFQINPLALRKVFDSVGEAVLVADAGGRVTDLNRYAIERFRLDPAKLLGEPLAEVLRAASLPPSVAEAVEGTVEVASDAGAAVLQVETAVIADAPGRMLGRIVVVRDITPQRRAEDALRADEEMVRSVVEQSPNGILRLRPFYSTAGRLRDFTITLANPSAARYLLTPLDRLLGARLTRLAPPHTGVLFDLFRRVLESQASAEVEVLTKVSGNMMWFRIIAVPIGSDVTVTVINITALKQRELQMQAAAQEDVLTTLLNRRGLEADAETLLAGQLPEEQRTFALLYIDLDDFKGVNDNYGHDAGDAVLIEVARRLRACTRGNDLVARIGGDEFVVLVSDCDDDTAEMMANRIREASRRPIAIERLQLHLSASVGVALATGTDATLPSLLHVGDTAMYQEKRRQGKGRGIVNGHVGDAVPE